MRLLIYGSKSFASTVAELIRCCGHEVVGYVDDFNVGPDILGSFAQCLQTHPPGQFGVVMGIGYANMAARWDAWQRVVSAGYATPSLVHPKASLAATAQLGQGCLVMAGAVVDSRARTGDAVVLWPQACVNHDVQVGSNTFISPGGIVCGDSIVGSRSFVGAGAVIADHVTVPEGSFVKMLSRFPAGQSGRALAGNPAASALPNPAAKAPALSIVSTMYRSKKFLDDFLAASCKAAEATGLGDFEIVLVNDGSPDDSLAHALKRCADLPNLVVVDLSRNFGHHHAIQAGLSQARGDLIFLIDCDLEVPPSCLVQMAEKLSSTGADVVYGYQESRKGGWFEQWSGQLFWKGINLLSDTRIPENVLTERLMSRRYVSALLQLGDQNLFMGGMMAWAGFTQLGMPIAKKQREGQSSYTFAKRLQLMVNAISSFSSKPLTWLFNVGVFITMLSFSYTGYLLVRKLLFGDALLGFTSMMALTAVSLGISTTAMGLVGIYLGKVYNQVQNRPTFIIKDIHRTR